MTPGAVTPGAVTPGAVTPGAPTEAQRKNAEREFELGLAAVEGGNDAAALQHFRFACLYLTTPVLLISTAETEIRLGKLVDAKKHLEQLRALPVSPLEGPSSIDARSRGSVLLPAIEQRLAKVGIDLVLPPGQSLSSLVACSNPAELIGDTIFIDPGPCRIVARNNLGQELVSDVALPEGTVTRVRFDFSVLSAPLPLTQPVPPRPADEAESQPNPLRDILRYGGVGLAGAGLLTGGITGLLAMNKKSKLDDVCDDGECPTSAQDDLDSARLMATISTIGFAAAGLGGLAVGISYFGFPDEQHKTGAMATFGGSF